MTAPAVGILPRPADVLGAAADRLEATYPAARLTSVDVTRVVVEAADRVLPGDESAAYRLACDALDALNAHRSELGLDPKVLDRWTSVFASAEMVAQMRAAAEQVPAVARG